MEFKFDKDPYFAKDPIRHSLFKYLPHKQKISGIPERKWVFEIGP